MQQGNGNKSFTLIETLFYISLLVSVLFVMSSFLIWTTRASNKSRVMGETADNARRAMEIITHEIREAESIYVPTSIFTLHPGQLSLETLKYVPTDEKNTYIDFYLSDGKLCLKKEAQDPICLTSERIEIKNLIFRQVSVNQIPSIEIDLSVDYRNPLGTPEYGASVNLRSVASPRSY